MRRLDATPPATAAAKLVASSRSASSTAACSTTSAAAAESASLHAGDMNQAAVAEGSPASIVRDAATATARLMRSMRWAGDRAAPISPLRCSSPRASKEPPPPPPSMALTHEASAGLNVRPVPPAPSVALLATLRWRSDSASTEASSDGAGETPRADDVAAARASSARAGASGGPSAVANAPTHAADTFDDSSSLLSARTKSEARCEFSMAWASRIGPGSLAAAAQASLAAATCRNTSGARASSFSHVQAFAASATEGSMPERVMGKAAATSRRIAPSASVRASASDAA
mmetsp:Transcript_997/g.3884  ORF Transcript_997/g.3884 Transcript_997/m.3884 type:complete len:289 (-) Transcript_997:4776-5642(-)